MLYHIVAASDNGVIGVNGRLPWHFPADLKFFKTTTSGTTVIMGRKTFESIEKPLPNRENIVISREPHVPIPGVQFVSSIDAAMEKAKNGKAFIIGGESIYRETLGRVDGIYLTHIHKNYEGDAFYPGVPSGFREVSRQTLQENPLIEVIHYERT